MIETLLQLKQTALESIERAENTAGLNELRVQYLGKKGELTLLLRQMGKLSAEDRPKFGQCCERGSKSY
jgi:phenylalanyl-tRNA synthetase alpha chain